MRFILFPILLILLVSCGGDKNSSGSSTSLSSNLSAPTTVEGYLYSNGTLEIAGGSYQMVSSLSGAQINQQIYSSGVQPIQMNGMQKYRARITGALYNPCQQDQNYNPSACQQSGGRSNLFYVTAIQFY